VSWRSSGGAQRYGVRYLEASSSSEAGAHTRWRRSTARTKGRFRGTPGHTYCFSARARDGAGNVSAWSGATCTSLPVDDRGLSASSAWDRRTAASRYRRTISVSSRQGASLSKGSVQARRLALLVDKCARCGTVKVFWNGSLLRSVDLRASSTRYRRIVTVARWHAPHTGAVKLRISSRGKRVAIDGLGAARSL
jgi:hypothetical protein